MGIGSKDQSAKKNRKKNKKIIFEDETVTKDCAAKILNSSDSQKLVKHDRKRELIENAKHKHNENNFRPSGSSTTGKKKSKNNKKRSHPNSSCNEDEVNANADSTISLNPSASNEEDVESQVDNESETLNTDVNVNEKSEESIRAKKRRRHIELLQAKKLRSELNLQQKCLNYLSTWKHSKLHWKFEKLKQIWLQQNMYDDTKVPEEFWDTLVEYFNSAKGQAKATLLKEAVKIVDSVQEIEGENSEETNVKYLRARNIVQNLQE